MKVFPSWAQELGLGNVSINGVDLPLHAPPELYQEVVNFIRNDGNSNGALVTTHKIDLFKGTHQLFDECDWFASQMHKVTSISNRPGKLTGRAKHPGPHGGSVPGVI